MHAMVWGSAPHTIVMVHGNPTWGFLWRRVIEELGDRYRIVVPDLIGLGRSSKPAASAHTLEHHAAWLVERIAAVPVNQLIMVKLAMNSASENSSRSAEIAHPIRAR